MLNVREVIENQAFCGQVIKREREREKEKYKEEAEKLFGHIDVGGLHIPIGFGKELRLSLKNLGLELFTLSHTCRRKGNLFPDVPILIPCFMLGFSSRDALALIYGSHIFIGHGLSE